MAVKPPRSALVAYSDARAWAESIAQTQRAYGHSLTTWDMGSVDLVFRALGSYQMALASLIGFLDHWGVPREPTSSLFNVAIAAYRSPDEDIVANAFWSHGIRDWPAPRMVLAWRYGRPPAGGRSFNYRDRFYEAGVSVAHIEDTDLDKGGAGQAYRMFFGDRGAVKVRGFWREDITGSDGEPLLVGVSVARRPRRDR